MDKLIRIGKGYLIGTILFFALTIIGVFILRFTPFKEDWSFFFLLFAFAVSCLFISMYMGSFFRKGGILCGVIFSVVFILLMIIIVSLSFSTFISLDMLSTLYLIPIAVGVVGGIAGTNLAK